MNKILQASINWRNYEGIKKLENLLALKECQLFSDQTEKNKLDYTPSPSLPKYKGKVEKVPLCVGIYNFIKSNIYQLRP